MIKRAFDLVAAVVIGLVTAPVWALAGLAIRLVDGAPVLHRATRVGRNGASFMLYKFRTMGSAAGPSVTAQGDPRITRTGSFLRRTKIDELPQLWNVIRGDMSLVGPRPEDPRYVERYSLEQRRLLSVAPGMTSPATIVYRREEEVLPVRRTRSARTSTRCCRPSSPSISSGWTGAPCVATSGFSPRPSRLCS